MKHVKLYENFDKLNEQMYVVMNRTDGFLASPKTMTDEEANKFIQDFPNRFKGQGYYLTSRRERIDPLDVELEKIPVDDDVEVGGEYEADENITMRGFVGNFQLKRGDKITIEEGKMPSKYKVTMPDGSRTEVAVKAIDDLIAGGRLKPVEVNEANTEAATRIKLNDEQKAKLKAIQAAYVKEHGKPDSKHYGAGTKNVTQGFGGHTGEFYKITPEFEAFLTSIGLTENGSFGFDEKAYYDLYEVDFDKGIITNIAVG